MATSNPAIVIEQLENEDDYDYDASALPLDCYDVVPEGMEEVDGVLFEKTGMTVTHASTQANLSGEWWNYAKVSGQRGKVYIEAPCQTDRQKRRPDVAYLTK